MGGFKDILHLLGVWLAQKAIALLKGTWSFKNITNDYRLNNITDDYQIVNITKEYQLEAV